MEHGEGARGAALGTAAWQRRGAGSVGGAEAAGGAEMTGGVGATEFSMGTCTVEAVELPVSSNTEWAERCRREGVERKDVDGETV